MHAHLHPLRRYTHIYTYIYACIYIYIFIYIYVCIYISMYICTCVQLFVCIYVLCTDGMIYSSSYGAYPKSHSLLRCPGAAEGSPKPRGPAAFRIPAGGHGLAAWPRFLKPLQDPKETKKSGSLSAIVTSQNHPHDTIFIS